MAEAYKITAADILALPDVYRDKIAKGTRLKYHVSLENSYQRNKNRPVDEDWGIELISGEKGTGKTTLASARAGKSYDNGRPVISNAGLLFGYRIDSGISLYNLINECPPNTHLVLDEIHALLGIYAQAKHTSVSFIGSLASVRKKNLKITGITQQEANLSNQFKHECDRVIYLKKWSPRKEKITYPPACYNKAMVLERPFRGRMIGEQYGLPIRDSKKVKKGLLNLHARDMYVGMVLQYSYEDAPSPLSSKLNKSAADLKKYLEENGDNPILTFGDNDNDERQFEIQNEENIYDVEQFFEDLRYIYLSQRLTIGQNPQFIANMLNRLDLADERPDFIPWNIDSKIVNQILKENIANYNGRSLTPKLLSSMFDMGDATESKLWASYCNVKQS